MVGYKGVWDMKIILSKPVKILVLVLSIYLGTMSPQPAQASDSFGLDTTLVVALVFSVGVNLLSVIGVAGYACVKSSRIFCNAERGSACGFCCLYAVCPCTANCIEEPEHIRLRRQTVEDELRPGYISDVDYGLNAARGYLDNIKADDIPQLIQHLQQRMNPPVHEEGNEELSA